MRILMILAGDPLGSAAPAARLERFVAPYYLFRDAGFDVVLASPDGGEMPLPRAGSRRQPGPLLDRLYRDMTARDALADTIAIAKVFADDFAGAFCLGVTGRVWRPEAGDAVAALIGRLLRDGKAVAVVPFGLDLAPAGLASGIIIGGDTTSATLQVAEALIAALYGGAEPAAALPAALDLNRQEDIG